MPVSLSDILLVLIPIALVTIALRQAPFGLVRGLQGSPLMALLALTMPVGVMTILAVYTMHSASHIGYALLAGAATLAIHWWRRDAGLSIISGTVIYMLLVNFL